MTDDVERIAKGLTKAQREAILHGDCVYMGNSACVCKSPELDALREAGLAGKAYSLDTNAFALTEKGQALRQYLERNS